MADRDGYPRHPRALFRDLTCASAGLVILYIGGKAGWYGDGAEPRVRNLDGPLLPSAAVALLRGLGVAGVKHALGH